MTVFRNRAAGAFEDISSWASKKGWRLSYTSRWWREELMCQMEPLPGFRSKFFRVLSNVSSWAMRVCMEKSK